MGKIRKIYKYFFLLAVIIFGAFVSIVQVPSIVASSSDDPGVTISAPESISSSGLVDLSVKLSSSSGKLNKDGSVLITIPKSIVADTSQLASKINLTDPFYLASPGNKTDANGNYILQVKYDASKIDPTEAVGYTFTIEFNAVYFKDHSIVDPNLTFSADLSVDNQVVSKDSSTSKTVPAQTGKPAFIKYSSSPSIEMNGQQQFVMSPTDSQANQFVVIVNYNKQSYDNLSVNDKLPAGLNLADSYSVFGNSSGDSSNIDHLKIYKVHFDDNGNIASTEYVTSQFKDNISVTDNALNVHFGQVGVDDAYVISYGASVNPGYDTSNFGTQYNNATMLNGSDTSYESSVPVTMHESISGATSLQKSVDRPQLATNASTLIYTLTLKNMSGSLKAGTIVSDPLPANVSYESTIQNSGFSDAEYNKSSNAVSYKLNEDIPMGQSRTIKVKVHFNNPGANSGDIIMNRASYTYAGATIYSNDATTLLKGSAILTKKDVKNDTPLAGAIFKLVDANNQLVKTNLTTDSDGNVDSGLLAPGEYSFIETSAPEGYALDPTPNRFTVVDGQSTTVKLVMYNSESININGKKTWVDGNNAMGVRPSTIKINLFADGMLQKSLSVSAKTNWAYFFNGVPKYDSKGTAIKYDVSEDSVDGYKSTKNGYNFTNMLIPSGLTPNTPSKPKKPAIPSVFENKPKQNMAKNPFTYNTQSHTTHAEELPKTGVNGEVWLSIIGVILTAGLIVYLRWH
ncbi:Cna B-type domain-containing protein [Weissella muntiaci]|uniref:Cna B-type domain-containing protein n=1 Tax=Weissella muntiaci TaxID=2508881 RepID=A0A6C2CAR7_9LACO|nr:Cna B-type domain-containing protein [Weissella muntiaci]TYC50529.1 Cna B-type domain-containing protein [Weissella muntiaci]